MRTPTKITGKLTFQEASHDWKVDMSSSLTPARVRDELMNHQNVDYAYANNAPHYVCPRRRTPLVHFRKTTKVEILFDAYGYRFIIVEKLIMQNPPNILSGEISSSEGSVYSVIDEEVAHQDGHQGQQVQEVAQGQQVQQDIQQHL